MGQVVELDSEAVQYSGFQNAHQDEVGVGQACVADSTEHRLRDGTRERA